MPITLQESLRGVFYAPFYVALAHDAYAAVGVDVRFVSAPEPGSAATQVMSGASWASTVGGGQPVGHAVPTNAAAEPTTRTDPLPATRATSSRLANCGATSVLPSAANICR